ncbi:Predicted metal-dependent enzyme of the double-stranded beta helix superfamily [Legionella steigerwaltii]|uniref:Cysteine dioxygenase type I n=1 Tax=Legionella steigerwaltii TaxID=460 RepID=A0A378LCF4_9GAMM|nr:cysteine dioxygenase [Legionella steigerwaltii]KTD80776.1 Cysteine dioxygenase type I [Legionella steigerwaltii]STY23538.1 Predicted metal-dependent enzyme of the double-stranded beta helix superfamily [Legionella steigerwaltii]
MFTKIEGIKQNEETITRAINELDKVSYDTVSKFIPKKLAEGSLKLDHSVYKPADSNTVMPHGVGRYLIYDHPDKSNPFSIWVFAFAPRQKTTIHDHKYKGTVTVLEGPVSEKYYQPTGKHTARLVNRIDRYRFHSNRDDLNGVFVHQLKRRKALGAGVSVTLHIYNMEAYLVNFEGEKTDRRNLNIIYSKDKTIDKENIPPYSDAYPERTFGK